MSSSTIRGLVSAVLLIGSSVTGVSMVATTCADLPKAAELKATLKAVIDNKESSSGGNGHPPWLVEVDSTGTVCAVVTYLDNPDVTTNQSGLGHRILAAYKANTSNIFSHDRIALASGNLYSLTLPGGQMYGTTLPTAAVGVFEAGDPAKWGTSKDPIIGKRVGGFSVLAGGLPLFNSEKHKVGAIGVSGNPFCTAHTVAWKVREKLANGAYTVANVPGGVGNHFTNDALIQDFDMTQPPGTAQFSPSGFGHPVCDANPPNATDDDSIEGNK